MRRRGDECTTLVHGQTSSTRQSRGLNRTGHGPEARRGWEETWTHNSPPELLPQPPRLPPGGRSGFMSTPAAPSSHTPDCFRSKSSYHVILFVNIPVCIVLKHKYNATITANFIKF